MELWDVYDSNGKPTGRVKAAYQGAEKGEYRLVCSLWIINQQRQALLQKRSMKKKVDPGKWNITGGHSIAGETSMQACIREAAEEIGMILQPEDIRLFTRSFVDGIIYDDYITTKEFNITDAIVQPEEVTELKWMTLAEIRELYDQGKFMFSDITKLDEVEKFLLTGLNDVKEQQR